jgi:hypothetical protein
MLEFDYLEIGWNEQSFPRHKCMLVSMIKFSLASKPALCTLPITSWELALPEVFDLYFCPPVLGWVGDTFTGLTRGCCFSIPVIVDRDCTLAICSTLFIVLSWLLVQEVRLPPLGATLCFCMSWGLQKLLWVCMFESILMATKYSMNLLKLLLQGIKCVSSC